MRSTVASASSDLIALEVMSARTGAVITNQGRDAGARAEVGQGRRLHKDCAQGRATSAAMQPRSHHPWSYPNKSIRPSQRSSISLICGLRVSCLAVVTVLWQ